MKTDAPDSTSPQRNEQDLARRISLERVHRAGSLISIHATVKSTVLDVLVVQRVAESGRARGKRG
jgi:hypothetical protein